MRLPLSVCALVSAVVAPLVAASGCSSSQPTGGACKTYETPASFVATTPAVSFKSDVAPIFAASCAFSSCHGNENGGNQAALYLGSNTAKVYANLVGVASTKYPQMSRISANDAKNSFLLHKIDGDSCTLPGCNGDCAYTMPDDAPVDQAMLLAVDRRDVVRRWVLQGAPNN